MDNRKRNDSVIAAVITFVVALLILLWLFFGGLTFDRAQLASVSTPEIQTVDEEELFLEPELIQDLREADLNKDEGEPEAAVQETPSPPVKGQPQPAEVENNKVVVPSKNEDPTPKPPVEKPVTQNKPSPVKATEPPKNDEAKQTVTSQMAGKFQSQNGSPSGSNESTGAAATAGIGAEGVANGRTFKSCPKPSVALQNKVVVVVTVTINSAGNVTKAIARSKSGNPSQSILTACQNAALKAKWSEDPNTPSVTGTITFTITPKK